MAARARSDATETKTLASASQSLGLISETALRAVRLTEIAGQTIRWAVFCIATSLAVNTIVGGWEQMHSQTSAWWQSPFLAILAATLPAAVIFLSLAFILAYRHRPPRPTVGSQLESITGPPAMRPKRLFTPAPNAEEPDEIRSLPTASELPSGAPFGLATTKEIAALELGESVYRLLKPCRLTVAQPSQEWIATLDGLSDSRFRGVALTGPKEAERLLLLLSIHREFQRLYLLRPMQHDAQSLKLWSQLQACIDVDAYKRNRQVPLFVKGVVMSIDQERITFQWIGGDLVSLDSEMLRDHWFELKVGDCFEAVLWRNAGQPNVMAKAEFVRHVPRSSSWNAESLNEWLDSLPAAQLPPRQQS
ncbi:MAG: hypothetical protein IT423_18520 [Pirellulaceae bacterium]|nr:hypothetical protein [Pirellulaceae bacterium]